MRRLKLPWFIGFVIITFLLGYPLNSAATELPIWELNIQSPKIETNVAAFLLQGKHRRDKVYISDLDIVITKENERLIPLLRLLRTLKAAGQIKDNIIEFVLDMGEKSVINLNEKTLTIKDETFPISVAIGISDITNQGEIFISENILKLAFGFDFNWSEEAYGYEIYIQKDLAIFKAKRLSGISALSIPVQDISEKLSETEPLASPISMPFIGFFEVNENSNLRRNEVYDREMRPLPDIGIWGSLGKGNYNIRLRNEYEFLDSIDNSDNQFISMRINNMLWTLNDEEYMINVGDTNVGFNDILLPRKSFFGTVVKWLPDNGDNDALRTCFFESRRPKFSSFGKFEGFAPPGSEVELWINNRLVENQTLEDRDKFNPERLSYKFYRFENDGIMSSSVSDVKIIEKWPDGSVHENRTKYLATDKLLPPGETAYLGILGTQRRRQAEQDTLQGQIIGLEALRGIFNWLTVGFAAVTETGFTSSKDEFGSYYPAPTRHHFTNELRCAFFNSFLSNMTFGLSNDPVVNSPAFAGLFDTTYYFKKILRFKTKIFSFAPEYSNGVVDVSDRRGGGVGAEWKIFKNCFFKTSFLNVSDNTNQQKAITQKDNLLDASLSVTGVVPRTTVQLLTGYLDRVEDTGMNEQTGLLGLDLETALNDRIHLNARHIMSDNETGISAFNELTYGLPVEDMISSQSPGTVLGANFKINRLAALSPQYLMSRSQEKISVLFNCYSSETRKWQSRLDCGYKMDEASLYFKEYLSFAMDKDGDNQFIIKADFDARDNEYAINFFVRCTDLFSVKPNTMKAISTREVSPRRGGLEGHVYLDLNCDGHRDKNEPGIPDIGVLIDGNFPVTTDADGNFFVAKKNGNKTVNVTIDMNSLPAIYTPTQGLQKAHWKEFSFTPVNLGLCVLNSVSGRLVAFGYDGSIQNVPGARVILMKEDRRTLVKDSITAYDGSYYIGEIKAGTYFMKIDKSSITSGYKLKDKKQFLQKIVMLPNPEPTDTENLDLYLIVPKPPSAPSDNSVFQSAYAETLL